MVEAEPGTGDALAGLAGPGAIHFFLIFGDVLFDMDLGRLAVFHAERGALTTLVVHPSDHPQDSDLVRVDRHARVRQFMLKPPQDAPLLQSGAMRECMPSLRTFWTTFPGGACDLMRDVFVPLLDKGLPLAVYRTPEHLKDMGTPRPVGPGRSGPRRGPRGRTQPGKSPARCFS